MKQFTHPYSPRRGPNPATLALACLILTALACVRSQGGDAGPFWSISRARATHRARWTADADCRAVDGCAKAHPRRADPDPDAGQPPQLTDHPHTGGSIYDCAR